MKEKHFHCERSESLRDEEPINYSRRRGNLLQIAASAFSILAITINGFCADEPGAQGLFDDAKILSGYTDQYYNEPREAIVGRINDDAINFYQTAAAIRVFKIKFSKIVVGREKLAIEQDLVRCIDRTNSPFVEVEIMHTLVLLDRYKYFDSMVPPLILKLDHYNQTVNEMAETALKDIIANGKNSPRDARIMFNTLRSVFFLSRNTLKKTTVPDSRLERKLNLLRWSVKVLGAQELKHLPKEIMHLL